MLHNVIFECCSAYVLVSAFFLIPSFNAIITMIAFLVVNAALALAIYSKRQQLTYNRVVHFGVLA